MEEKAAIKRKSFYEWRNKSLNTGHEGKSNSDRKSENIKVAENCDFPHDSCVKSIRGFLDKKNTETEKLIKNIFLD